MFPLVADVCSVSVRQESTGRAELLSLFPQNYLKAAWNVFDFVTVLGSITDILVTEIKVGRSATPLEAALSTAAVAPWKHIMQLGSSLFYVVFFLFLLGFILSFYWCINVN